MGLFKWLLKRKVKKYSNHGILTDAMREKSLETRRLQHQINQLEKQVNMKKHLDILEKGLTSGSKPDIEQMFMMMIMKSMFPQNTPQQQPIQQPRQITLSDEQLKEYIEGNSQYLHLVKDFSDEEIRRLIKLQAPQLADETVERGIKMVRAYEK